MTPMRRPSKRRLQSGVMRLLRWLQRILHRLRGEPRFTASRIMVGVDPGSPSARSMIVEWVNAGRPGEDDVIRAREAARNWMLDLTIGSRVGKSVVSHELAQQARAAGREVVEIDVKGGSAFGPWVPVEHKHDGLKSLVTSGRQHGFITPSSRLDFEQLPHRIHHYVELRPMGSPEPFHPPRITDEEVAVLVPRLARFRLALRLNLARDILGAPAYRTALPVSTLRRCRFCGCVMDNPADWPHSADTGGECVWCLAVHFDDSHAARIIWGPYADTCIAIADEFGHDVTWPPSGVYRRPVTAPTVRCYR